MNKNKNAKRKKIADRVPSNKFRVVFDIKDENDKVQDSVVVKFKIPPGVEIDPRDALNDIVRITNEVRTDSTDKSEPLPFPERLFKPKKREVLK